MHKYISWLRATNLGPFLSISIHFYPFLSMSTMKLTSGCIANLHELSLATKKDSNVTVWTKKKETMPPRTRLSRSLRILGLLFDLPENREKKCAEMTLRIWHSECVQISSVSSITWANPPPLACLACLVCLVPVQSSFLGEGHTVPRGAEGQVLATSR